MRSGVNTSAADEGSTITQTPEHLEHTYAHTPRKSQPQYYLNRLLTHFQIVQDCAFILFQSLQVLTAMSGVKPPESSEHLLKRGPRNSSTQYLTDWRNGIDMLHCLARRLHAPLFKHFFL